MEETNLLDSVEAEGVEEIVKDNQTEDAPVEEGLEPVIKEEGIDMYENIDFINYNEVIYNTFGFIGEIASPILPILVLGNPFVSFEASFLLKP